MEPEQRRYVRVPFNETIVVNASVHARAASISRGGMAILTNQAFPLSNSIGITFPIERAKVSLTTEIRHFQAGIGMGVMFMDIEEEQKELIHHYIDRIYRSRVGKEPARILLVDNNSEKRTAYKTALSLSGYEILEATSEENAMDLMKSIKIDVFVVDPFLPRGFPLVRKARMMPETRKALAIVLASRPVSNMQKKMFLPTVRHVLLKMNTPPPRLQQIIARYIA